MKINVNAFIAVILCAALLSGLWVLSNSRDELETNIWSPHAIYEQVGGSSYVSPELPTYSSRSSSDDVVVKMSPSRTMSRRVSSVPYGLIPSSPYGLMTSSPNGLAASSPHGLITYASSNATYHSFGGGGDMSGGMSGGSFRANPEAMPAAAALSVPSMPNYAMVQGSSAWQPEQTIQGASAIIAAAPSRVPANSWLASMRGPIFQVGANSLLLQGGGAGFPVNANKRAFGIGGMFDEWLQGLVDEGLGVWNEDDGLYYFGNSELETAYLEAIANGQLPVGATWEQFVAWFYGQSDKYAFVPIPDGMWFMCFLVLLYVVLMIRKRKIAKTI